MEKCRGINRNEWRKIKNKTKKSKKWNKRNIVKNIGKEDKEGSECRRNMDINEENKNEKKSKVGKKWKERKEKENERIQQRWKIDK